MQRGFVLLFGGGMVRYSLARLIVVLACVTVWLVGSSWSVEMCVCSLCCCLLFGCSVVCFDWCVCMYRCSMRVGCLIWCVVTVAFVFLFLLSDGGLFVC